MDAIDFIEADVRRSRRRKMPLTLCFALGIAMIPAGLGLALRDDLNGAFDPRILIPNTLAALALFWVALIAGSRSRLKNRTLILAVIVLSCGLLLAVERVFFPLGIRTSYASAADFWHEADRCLFKGSLTSFCFSVWTAGFAFMCSSLPTLRRRAVISLASGTAGAVMLGFHCDSSSFAHVAVSHIGQGILAGFLVFGIQEWIFRTIVLKQLPWLRGKLSSVRKPG